MEKQHLVEKEKILKNLKKEYPSLKYIYLPYEENLRDLKFININKLSNKLYTQYPLIPLRISLSNRKPRYIMYDIVKNKIIEVLYDAGFILNIFYKKINFYKIPVFTLKKEDKEITKKYISYEEAEFIKYYIEKTTETLLGKNFVKTYLFGFDYYKNFIQNVYGFAEHKNEYSLVIQLQSHLKIHNDFIDIFKEINDTIIHELAHILQFYLSDINCDFIEYSDDLHNYQFYNIINILKNYQKKRKNVIKDLNLLKDEILKEENKIIDEVFKFLADNNITI